MPVIIVISDDDDALLGIPAQPAAAIRHFTGAALHQEQVIAAANLLSPSPVAKSSDAMIAAHHRRSGDGVDISPHPLTAASFPELPTAAVRHLISATLMQEPPIAVTNLIAPLPIQPCPVGVISALNSQSADVSAAALLAAGPLGARHAMHAYFAQFAGCRNSALEVVPVAPVDGDLLDLRRALPPVQWPAQFLELEAVHVDAFVGDSSGRSMDSFSGSNSLDSFIDDAPVEISAIDAANVAQFVADVLPITADVLRLPDLSPATVAARKRRRWVISSSSSSPPHPPAQDGARRRVVASSSPSPPALAPSKSSVPC
jgi:hypothetical protein